MNDVMGWWFGQRGDDGEVRLPNGDGRIVRAGETISVDGVIVPCKHGLHASVRPLDALGYAPPTNRIVVARVRLSGTVVESGDKHAASRRETLWMADCADALRWFATDVAEAALLTERKLGREPDRRSWNAVTVARRYLQGLATTEERAAARAAAWDAARAAGAAAWDAAWDAGDAARAAAWAAARAAANDLLLINLEGLEP